MRAKAGTRIAGLLVAVAVMAAPQAATAATTIGQTFTPTQDCSTPTTYLQSGSLSPSYAAPSAGVITSWSYQAPAVSPPQMRFKVGRPAGGANYTIIGQDPTMRSPEAGLLKTYAVQIPVLKGDILGVYMGTTGKCAREIAGWGGGFTNVAEPTPGTTTAFTLFTGSQFDLSASLEADGDGDGFGDETQDGCPADPARQAPPCAPPSGGSGGGGGSAGKDTIAPETTITKKPAAKTKRKKATFEFSSSEAGSSFQCQLDGKGFKPCTSPLTTAKLKKGKHSFEVKATDAAGNTDATAASASWKIVKKKAPKKAHHK